MHRNFSNTEKLFFQGLLKQILTIELAHYSLVSKKIFYVNSVHFYAFI